MKAIHTILLRFQGFTFPVRDSIKILEKRTGLLLQQAKGWKVTRIISLYWNEAGLLYNTLKRLGVTSRMDEYEKRKLSIFNQLNFLQLISALIVPVVALSADEKLSTIKFIITLLPSFVSLLVLSLNFHRRYEAARISYFLLYPVITSIIYMGGMNLGVELYFILYGILSVFFIPQIGQMLFSVSLSMVSYFILSVVWKNYHYQLATIHGGFYLFNQLLAIGLIFYGLYLIKRENTGYQFKILKKSQMLHYKNLEIRKQEQELVEKAALLEKQAARLNESIAIKNKLFSVIAHDLKTPMYALRTLFQNIKQFKMPAKEVREFLPDIVNDLNYTTGLMDNLLHWAKNQMHENTVRPQVLDLSPITTDVLHLLRLQANTKKIRIDNKISEPVYAFADKDMIHLVLRNLLSNAIKFTPLRGKITIGINETTHYVEVYIQDTGVGISREEFA